MKIFSPLVMLFLLGGLPSSNTPEDAAKEFYSIVMKVPKWGVPDENNLNFLAPSMSKRLTTLFRNALAYKKQFIKEKLPNDGMLIGQYKPPFSDGDCFSSSFEGATKFTIGKSTKIANKYRIDLHLEFDDTIRPGKPIAWTDAIYVIKKNDRFVVDDMEFLGTWDFGNHGLLSEMLKSR
jgi:hypothetical protein